jgi:hypothetical protein
LGRAVGVVDIGQRKRRQVERRGPALRALDEDLDRVWAQSQAAGSQQVVGFGVGHRKIGGVELGQGAVGAQATEPDRGLSARGERELRALRQSLGDRGDDGERLGVVERMDVVEREHQRVGRPLQRVEQPWDRDLEGSGPRAMECRIDLLADRQQVGDRTRDRGGERDRVVVAVAERKPGERPVVDAVPVLEHARLPEPGRSVNEHHGRLLTFE